jgi:hypothetical protein
VPAHHIVHKQISPVAADELKPLEHPVENVPESRGGQCGACEAAQSGVGVEVGPESAVAAALPGRSDDGLQAVHAGPYQLVE